jgi:thymidine kinase
MTEQSFSYNPSLELIIGPMMCSKTTELIRRLTIYHELGLKVLYINTLLDSRTELNFSTHNKTIGTVFFDTIKVQSLDNVDVEKYDVIGIDEAQFFKELRKNILNFVDIKNKIVVVAGLNGDYKREKFGEILDIIPLCDKLTKLSSYCTECSKSGKIRDAHFTKRTVNENKKILIGGKESYTPTCRECFNNEKN